MEPAIVIPLVVIASGALDGEMRPLTPDEKLIMALIPITFCGVVTFVFWTFQSDSKVATGFLRIVEKVNDFLTFGRNR